MEAGKRRLAVVFINACVHPGYDEIPIVQNRNGWMLLVATEILVDREPCCEFGAIFYEPNNVLHGELLNGRWKGTGAFAITDGDQVCVSMATDNGRYRCLTSVRVGETVQKFDADDKMTFELTGFESATGL